MSPIGLLVFRLSPDDFKSYIAETRRSRLGYDEQLLQSDPEIDPFKLQAIIVRGFDADAVAVIKAANDGKETVLNVSYSLEQQMFVVIRKVEDILRVPSEHWRLTPKTRLCGVYNTLIDTFYNVKPQPKPIELLLIPQSAVTRYLAQHEYMRDWKRLQPAPPPPSSPADPLAQARATWHLLSPMQDNYVTQRRDAEWNLVLMRQRESLSFTVPLFLDKIKDGVETILQRTELSADEQAVIADGILPQALELDEVTAFTHISSPTRPATLDVFLHYPFPCNIKILYRLHDPVPAPVLGALPQSFNIRGVETHPQHRLDSWRLLFEMNISQVHKRTRRGMKDVERRMWGLTQADALRVHAALFGAADAADAVGAKVSVLDAMLLVLASVGFHMQLKQANADEGARFADEDRFGYWEGGHWKLGKLEWIAGNLRTVCGVPLKGDTLCMGEVVEDDSDW
ncbi:hypothetical protein LXA43DRAFT_1057129 [Ganoderma leucocontextum]|nr:hypothetical protein LXA43DRAFT_1057129 [Ganoderma leucocontextum]